MTPTPPVANPTLPPGTSGSNVQPRSNVDVLPAPRVQPLPQPNTVPPLQPSLTAPSPAGAPAIKSDTRKSEGATRSAMDSFQVCMGMYMPNATMTRRQWAASCRDTLAPRMVRNGPWEGW